MGECVSVCVACVCGCVRLHVCMSLCVSSVRVLCVCVVLTAQVPATKVKENVFLHTWSDYMKGT